MSDERCLRVTHKWDGMLSMWGQGEKAWQGVCYGDFCYAPERYVKIASDGKPVSKWFARWCDLDLAQWWLDYIVNNLAPAEVLKGVQIRRTKNKADWPAKWAATMARKDIFDVYFEDEPNWAEAEKVWGEKRMKSRHGGLVPWLRIDFEQSLTAVDMFVFAVLTRYASEHTDMITLLRALDEDAPKVSASAKFVAAQNIAGANGHAIGNFACIPVMNYGKLIKKYNFIKQWEELREDHRPFHLQPKKQTSIDTTIRWPADLSRTYDLYGNIKEKYYAAQPGYGNMNEITLAGQKFLVEHNHPQEMWDLTKKVFAK